ncbi:MAG: hypothetical protein UT18_C0029G0016 [candidate division CPR2 bacterium GW2011_GWC2_39_10]|uniref:Uncharacterized protein n=1 Tax=candidate division CPR2 bacterium GW2011_GWC2_39_10 TaxID=1618345 RepID=A0A0G0P4H4_UNCC2|nr:MAG: hypothetical protein UT18_C0029G0016 [candidate division CPR2 bacterium GW2011_GWC2_39_10]
MSEQNHHFSDKDQMPSISPDDKKDEFEVGAQQIMNDYPGISREEAAEYCRLHLDRNRKNGEAKSRYEKDFGNTEAEYMIMDYLESLKIVERTELATSYEDLVEKVDGWVEFCMPGEADGNLIFGIQCTMSSVKGAVPKDAEKEIRPNAKIKAKYPEILNSVICIKIDKKHVEIADNARKSSIDEKRLADCLPSETKNSIIRQLIEGLTPQQKRIFLEAYVHN